MKRGTVIRHVVPTKDVIEHTLDPECACQPDVEPVPLRDGRIGTIYVHHSWDGREQRE